MDHEQKAKLFRADEATAWALFSRANAVRMAAVADGGVPLLRTLHGVVVDDRLCFHAADRGEKLALLDRPAIASCEQIVAEIPSYWLHPEHACPATTYYLSALVEGRVERVLDRAQKARVLEKLMERFQPEGGYLPITAADSHYAKVLDTLLVAELVPTRVSAKRKLGQHRTVAQIERVLAGLWQRGTADDLRAIRMIREAHPGRPDPVFLRGPHGSELCVAPDEADAVQVASLLEGQYWTTPFSAACLAAAQRGSPAWIVARDPATRAVIASARAVGDGARYAYVMDVVVHPARRRQGFGRALMTLLLDHPALRRAARIGLRTRDAQAMYRPFGFVPVHPQGEELGLNRG
jgi:ribosomal protein S18 acetylase RimI-like enzyme/nitroimidazol reductase NimA-like FMN-containing flavoprotein (pyridoxamine 5'-phosphate oxidase superfamily)